MLDLERLNGADCDRWKHLADLTLLFAHHRLVSGEDLQFTVGKGVGIPLSGRSLEFFNLIDNKHKAGYPDPVAVTG